MPAVLSKGLKTIAAWSFAALLAACASNSGVRQAERSGQVDAADAPYLEMLHKGRAAVEAGSPRKAIDQYFDPVIAHYDALYRNGGKRVFGARSMQESFVYAALAAADNQSASVVSSGWGDAYFFKAYALVDLGDLDGAQQALQAALAISPQNASYLEELGHIYQTRNDWEKAMTTFRQAEDAAAFSPENRQTEELTRAWRGVGFALIEQGKLAEAEEYYRRCLQKNRDDAMAKNELRYIEQLRQKAKTGR